MSSNINYDVGDLVKDHFDRIHIVLSLNHNRDGRVYSVTLSPVTGNGVVHRVFPTDVALLNGNK